MKDTGIAHLEAAIWEQPDDWRGYVELAEALMQKEASGKVLLYLNEIAHRTPKDAGTQLQVGELYFNARATDLAIPHLKAAAAGAPNDPRSRLLLGTALLIEKKMVEAEATLRNAAKAGASTAEVQKHAAQGLHPSGDVAQALAALTELERTGVADPATSALRVLLGGAQQRAPAEFSGDLTWFGVPEFLDFFYNQHATGTILVRTPLEEARIQLHQGMLTGVWASETPTLADALVQDQVVTPETIASTLLSDNDVRYGPRLVDALIRDGWLTREELTPKVRAHVLSMIVKILNWRDGRVTFAAADPDDVPKAVTIDTRQLLLQAAWTVDEENR